MCGICGFISLGEKMPAANLLKMNYAIRHRGPDDEGYAIMEGNSWKLYAGEASQSRIKQNYPLLQSDQNFHVALGFRRLSIMDLSHRGHQPMTNEANTVVLTFNGEIYNYKELRQELKTKGYHFKSDCDTEVILNGYLHWGVDVIHRLNGMFALVIVDLPRNKMWIVRDRMGIKPLFYHVVDGKFSWASEIKALLQLSWVQPDIDFKGLTSNYLLQTSATSLSVFKNIRSLRPAHFIELDFRTLAFTEQEYWKLPRAGQTKVAATEAAEQVQRLLRQAVQRQLAADVPVVSLMSGGIDSTTLTALASELHPGIHSYTMGFQVKDNDELPQAKRMAEKLGIKQHVHIIKPEDLIGNLLSTLEHYEEPYTSLETVVEASRFIHDQGYKVALNGNGADEVFGGYSYVLHLERWRKSRRLATIQPFIPGGHAFLNRVKNYLELNSVFRFFVNSTQGLRLQQLRELDMPGLEENSKELLQRLPVDESSFQQDYEALFQYDMNYSVASHHVYREDMSAMRYSLEMRYPYLDHELIEFVAGLPIAIRYNGTENKPLLRKAAEPYITVDNLMMPKKGFAMPGDTWMREHPAIIDFARHHIEALMKRDFLNNRTIKKWWLEKDHVGTFYRIWQLVTTEVWLRKYID